MDRIPKWAVIAGAAVLLVLAILIGMRAVKSTDNGSFVAPTDPNRYQKEMQKRSGSYGAPNGGGQPGQGGGAPGRGGAPAGYGGAPGGGGAPSGYGAPAGAPGGSGAPYGQR